MRPDEVLDSLLRSDPAAPRVTYYDDTDGPTRGERIELSGKVLANWVAKAGNLLVEEFDAAPGASIALDLPAEHWRTLYWALAGWSVGGAITDDPADADVVVSEAADAASPERLVLVTPAALARAHPEGAPAGAIDEAKELATYPDVFDALDEPEEDDIALVIDGTSWTYGDVVPETEGPSRRLVRGDLAEVLRSVLRVWAGGGSVLMSRDTDEATLADRLRVEGAEA